MEEALPSLGQRLKQKREEKNMTLEELADRTKIPLSNLEALEYDDEERLPAPVYIKGFIRAYARELDMDHKQLFEDYLEAYPSEPDKLELTVSTAPLPRNWTLPFFVIVFIVAVILMLASYYYLNFSDQPESSPKPSKLISKKIEPAKTPVQKQEEPRTEASDTEAEKTAAEPDPEKKTELTEDQKVTEADEPDQQPEAESDEPANALADADDTSSEAPKEHELRVVALEETWLRVNSDDEKIRQYLLKKGESMTYHAFNYFMLRVGNAGGLDVFIDGKAQPPLGPRGMVLEVTLTVSGDEPVKSTSISND